MKKLTDILDVDIDQPPQLTNGKWMLVVRFIANNDIDRVAAGRGIAFETYNDREAAAELIIGLTIDLKYEAEKNRKK